MALRFTETNKWKDDWYLSLTNDHRIIWQYILDNCSIAGVWQRGFKSMNYFCGTNITEPEFFEVFKGRVFEVENSSAIFIPKFLKVQYPKGLGSNKPLIVSVLKEIEKFNLSTIITQSLGNHYPMIKVTGKGKGKGKRSKEAGKGEGGAGEGPEPEKTEIVYPFDSSLFRSAWQFWKHYKKDEHRFAYKGEQYEQIALKELAELSGNKEDVAMKIIQQSVANGWKGLFKLKIIKNEPYKFGAKIDLDELDKSANEFLRKSGYGGTGS